jgi:hypothetical protein
MGFGAALQQQQKRQTQGQSVIGFEATEKTTRDIMRLSHSFEHLSLFIFPSFIHLALGFGVGASSEPEHEQLTYYCCCSNE